MTHEDEHGRGQGDEALQPTTKPLIVGRVQVGKDGNSSDVPWRPPWLHLAAIVASSAKGRDARQKTA